MKLSTNLFKKILLLIADRMEEEKDYLSELDRAIGDGDHGVTMSIGWQAIKEKLTEFDDQSQCADISKAVGMTFLSAVGSSVGPLYATAFIRGAAALQGKNELNEDDIIEFWVSAVKGIQDRGKAQLGGKTMLDTWIPVIESLQEGKRQGIDFTSCLKGAVAAGERGMEATKDMLSLMGRSSRLGERSLGHLDPGAVSAYFIFSTFCDAIISYQNA
jgi:phosphoenolpyruvate---glycerone phosphotransferase subunit DhaL